MIMYGVWDTEGIPQGVFLFFSYAGVFGLLDILFDNGILDLLHSQGADGRWVSRFMGGS